MKVLWVGMLATTFVLGMGFLAVIFLFLKLARQQVM